MKFKKKARLEMETWMKMILSIPVILVFVWLGANVYDFVIGAPNEKSVDNLENLVEEIGLFISEVEEKGESSTTVPYFVEKDFVVVAYNYEEGKKIPSKCRRKNCLCLNTIEDNNPMECFPLKEAYFKDTNKPLICNKEGKDLFDVKIVGEKKDNKIELAIEEGCTT